MKAVATPERTALSVHDLHVYLGESHVLQGVSFDVPDGGVTAVLGRNGVGEDDDAARDDGPRAAPRHSVRLPARS